VLGARPKAKAIDLARLRLSPEEGFVLSRVDGSTSVKDLVALTGLDESRVLAIVDRLAEQGVIEIPPCVDDELRAFLADDTAAASEATEPANDLGPADATDPEPVEEPVEEPAPASAPPEEEPRNERAYREIFETVYHPRPRDERVRAASEVRDADLCALCYDPDPQVVHAVLTNPRAGLEHARLVALHHRTHVGLEAVARRTELLNDALVQRRLLRNPQLPGTILNRLLGPKLLIDVYKAAVDREIPERSRVMTREVLRKKFTVASGDEKASLLFKTEGRCLLLLVQCSLDAHATQILCGKNQFTLLFIQNLARWSATPPAILAHLLKMPVVRRNVGLRKMLLKHPNTPSEAKRQG